MSWLSQLVERQIQKARLQGQLQGLKGEGRPLAERPGDAYVSTGDAIGFRIMAEAGVLPQEILLKKQIIAERAALQELTDEAERAAALARITQLELRQAIAAEARRRFMND